MIGSQDARSDDGFAEIGEQRSAGNVAAATRGGPNLGPCLYLGPQGQRCARPALEGGFCAVHRPGGGTLTGTLAGSARKASRVLAAGAAIVAIVWPYVADLLRELFRWMHSR